MPLLWKFDAIPANRMAATRAPRIVVAVGLATFAAKPPHCADRVPSTAKFGAVVGSERWVMSSVCGDEAL